MLETGADIVMNYSSATWSLKKKGSCGKLGSGKDKPVGDGMDFLSVWLEEETAE